MYETNVEILQKNLTSLISIFDYYNEKVRNLLLTEKKNRKRQFILKRGRKKIYIKQNQLNDTFGPTEERNALIISLPRRRY